MSREELLKNTVKYLKKLPNEKVNEVHDFAEFLYLKHEEYILQKGIQQLESESKSFLSFSQVSLILVSISSKIFAESAKVPCDLFSIESL